jgi:flagellar biosynthesis component FlhA
MTTLTEKHQQELKDHRDSQNKDRLYQATKADSNKPVKLPVGIELNELKNKQHNYELDQENKKMREFFKRVADEGGSWSLNKFNLELKKAMENFK